MKISSPKIWLLGATFETANMGINALAESSLKCIITHWPQAELTLRAHQQEMTQMVTVMGQTVKIQRVGLYFGKNIFLPNHVYRLIVSALLVRGLPIAWWRRKLEQHNPCFKLIMSADLVTDITGGDSFSDIYGNTKFIRNLLPKLLFVAAGKPVVLLPQTYGPFNSKWAKWFASYLLARMTAIYSRDSQGLEEVKKLLGPKLAAQKIIRFIPDVAFVLETEPPVAALLESIEQFKTQGQIIVGINISGLLYNGGESAHRQFGLNSDYRKMMSNIIKMFLAYDKIIVVLVPHVFSDKSLVESDPQACDLIREQFREDYPHRVFLVEDHLNHKQVKYLIGRCDFFLGARMHACIGALSQAIPAIGMAYSGKFKGVFDSVGMGDTVVDLRSETEEQILAKIQAAFAKRQEHAEKLRKILPAIQQQVLGLFDEIDSLLKW
ncbi:MAG: hypothetical protein BWK78_01030 [Thiotrichaceae bacterium IS1]|nr:MAG: hypothetical protein BWK78_01030 [Thiotrichaceae bacterium IS1]